MCVLCLVSQCYSSSPYQLCPQLQVFWTPLFPKSPPALLPPRSLRTIFFAWKVPLIDFSSQIIMGLVTFHRVFLILPSLPISPLANLLNHQNFLLTHHIQYVVFSYSRSGLLQLLSSMSTEKISLCLPFWTKQAKQMKDAYLVNNF